THLTANTRRLLPAAGLFHGVADANILPLFSEQPGVPARFAGASGEDWDQALEDAARVGLLTGLGAGMYRVHPTLPAYLAGPWRTEAPGGYDRSPRPPTGATAAVSAAFGHWVCT